MKKRKRSKRVYTTLNEAFEMVAFLLNNPMLRKMGISALGSLKIYDLDVVQELCQKLRKKRLSKVKFIENMQRLGANNFEITSLLKKNVNE